MLREPKGYIAGEAGIVVMVPARVAAKLDRALDLQELRISSRGLDPEFTNVLTALHIAALNWRSTETGTAEAEPAEQTRELNQWLTTRQAGTTLGISERGVRLAISRGTLNAEQTEAGHWRINREDLDGYRTHQDRRTA